MIKNNDSIKMTVIMAICIISAIFIYGKIICDIIVLKSSFQKIYHIIAITICLISSIFIYGKIRCNNPDFKDPLQIKIPIWDLDGWSILHFFTFLYFGYLFPNYLFLAMIIGILWELFEFFYGYFKPTFLKGWGHCISTDLIDKDNNNIWWYGKISDLACNFTGFICGMYFRKIF